VYGSLDQALAMTPRQLSAVLECEGKSKSRDLLDDFGISRAAAHGDKRDAEKLTKELRRGAE
jgi:hypothetical protein